MHDGCEYNEVTALMDYLRFHPELLSDSERAADRAFLAMKKANLADDQGDHTLAVMIRHAWAQSTKEIDELMSAGETAFVERVTSRVLGLEQRSHLIINRCPCCEKVVRTAAAKQCLWCGHDWH